MAVDTLAVDIQMGLLKAPAQVVRHNVRIAMVLDIVLIVMEGEKQK